MKEDNADLSVLHKYLVITDGIIGHTRLCNCETHVSVRFCILFSSVSDPDLDLIESVDPDHNPEGQKRLTKKKISWFEEMDVPNL